MSFSVTSISSSLFVNETRKEIGIYSLYGYSKKSVKKLFKIFSYLLVFYSFVISSFSLIGLTLFIQYSESFIILNDISILLIPFEVMFLVTIAIGFIASRLSVRDVFKQNTLKQLKER